jgi:hypothetical protein
VSDDLFAVTGPEGRNADAREFELDMALVARDLGYTVLEVNVDTLIGAGARSQGIDAIWACPNPHTGRGDGWLIESKRHDGAGRFTEKLVTEEVQRLRDKVGRLVNQRRRFFEDPEIRQHVQDLCGGLIAHHTPGFDPDRASRVLGAVQTARNEVGSRPAQILFIGPDTLNAVAACFERYGPPDAFWWPPTLERDGAWHSSCPLAQLAVGLFLYRTTAGQTVLLIRDRLSRHDPAALRELAWRMGQNLDRVVFSHATKQECRIVSSAWARVHEQTSGLEKGQLPRKVEAMDIGHATMSSFESRWDCTADRRTTAPAAHPTAAPVALQKQGPNSLPVRSRRSLQAYPSTLQVATTFQERASLHGAKRFLASERLVVFADEKTGTARAAQQTWLRPSAYRRMGHMLDLAPAPTVMGFTLTRLKSPQMQIATSMPGATGLLGEFRVAAATLKGQAFDPERAIRLTRVNPSDGAWSTRLELSYEHVFDLVGGGRVIDEAHTSLLAREVDVDTVDIVVVALRAEDFAAACAWLNAAVRPTERRWILTPAAIPRDEPRREQGLRATVRAVANERLIGLTSPRQHRDHLRPVGDGFASLIRDVRYDTDFCDIDTLLDRADADGLAVGEFTAHCAVMGASNSAVAMRLRQRARDAHLSVTWHAGKSLADDTLAGKLDRAAWDLQPALEWTGDEKQEFILGAWRRVVEALRADALAVESVAKSA